MIHRATIVYLGLMTGLAACSSGTSNLNSQNTFTELKRVTSPDGTIDAVLIEADGGATVATANRVCLVLHGQKLPPDQLSEAILLADHCQQLDLKWRGNRLLSVLYHKARIFQFSNFWLSEPLNPKTDMVELRLEVLP